jgi:hypothetical protein
VLSQTKTPVNVSFDNSDLEHPAKNRQRPRGLFTKSPFASSAATNLLARNKLILKRLQKLTNLCLISIHSLPLMTDCLVTPALPSIYEPVEELP